MPIEEIIDTGDEDGPVELIYEAFHQVVANATHAHVVKVQRGRVTDRLVHVVRIKYTESDDPLELAMEVARKLVAYAERDAGDREVKYRAAIFGRPEGKELKPPTLCDPVNFTIGNDEQSEVSTTKAATSFANQLAERQLKLLDNTASIFARLAPVAKLANDANMATSEAHAKAMVEIERIRSDDRRDLRDEKVTEYLVGFFRELMSSNLGNAVTFYIAEKAMHMRAEREKAAKAGG